jgi:predicted lipoprotein with Yx(FWY)xxD motif
MLVATAAIHLDLYLTGYKTIPTISWLFLVQVIVAFALGAIVLLSGSRVASAAGAAFAVMTLGGYLLSLRISLFGFREVRTVAGIVTGAIEVAAFATLAVFVLSPSTEHRVTGLTTIGASRFARLQTATPNARWVIARWAVAAFSALAAVLLGISLSVTGPQSTNSGSSITLLKVATVHGATVLTNAQGYTLYWFAPDTSTKSTCYDTCAVYWPPVTGSSTKVADMTGKLGTISRTDSTTQVTYNGHPLYTYIGDSAPGQDTGNKVNLNGGFWYEMAVSG